jgi:hypothetical protein
MAITGTPVFDAIAIATVEINVLEKSLGAKAAFVNTRNGETHGWTEGNGAIWTKETKDAAAALIAAMERDLAALHLGTAPEAQKANSPSSPVSGLREHLTDGDDVRSV